MRPGELRHRVTIKGFTEAKDTHGGFTATGTTVAARIPACVEELSGRELERAQMIDPRSSHLVRIWYRTGITAGMTVTYHDGRRGDRNFELVAPPKEIDGEHWELHLLCKEAE